MYQTLQQFNISMNGESGAPCVQQCHGYVPTSSLFAHGRAPRRKVGSCGLPKPCTSCMMCAHIHKQSLYVERSVWKCYGLQSRACHLLSKCLCVCQGMHCCTATPHVCHKATMTSNICWQWPSRADLNGQYHIQRCSNVCEVQHYGVKCCSNSLCAHHCHPSGAMLDGWKDVDVLSSRVDGSKVA